MIWTTKDNQQIEIKDMTYDHLINSIRYLVNDFGFGTLEKDGQTDKDWVIQMIQELIKRDEQLVQCKNIEQVNNILKG